MATTATTTTYQYPYPLGGDSLSNVATRIKELADRSEIVTAQIVSGNITLAPGTIYNASIAAAAAISYSKLDLTGAILNADLAGSIAPSKITGTAITAADTATVTGTMIASGVALAGNPTTTTQAQSNNSTRVATTAYVDAYVTGTVPDDSLTNVKINSAAAIAYSKLNLATSIVNTDVSASAAIAYSKLNLAASVTSADIVSVTLNQIPSYESYRNIIINGGFAVWQRGDGATAFGNTTTPFYGPDMWMCYRNSNVTGGAVTRQASALSNFTYCARVQRANANATTNSLGISNCFETTTIKPLHGKYLTLSFWARAGSGFSAASSILNGQLLWGTGTEVNNVRTGFTGATALFNSTYTLTTSWQKFTFTSTSTLSSTATQLGVIMNYTPVGTAGANDYFEITGVQLETGSVATPFEFEPYETTLRKCQRYFTRYTDAGNGFFPQSLAHTDLAGRPEVTILYTEKRSDSVAITFSSAAAISVQNIMTGTAYNSTGLNFYAGFNRFCATLFIDTGAGAPVNVPYQAALRTSAYMDISSEL